MESLAYLVVIILMIVILGGPVAILLTKIRTKNIFLTTIRRLLHGLIISLSFAISSSVFLKPQEPLTLHVIGIFGITMSYIALRREYFPHVKIVSQLFARFGIHGKSVNTSGEGLEAFGGETQANKKPLSSMHGPVIKWRRDGRSGGNDGHGPGGQH